MARHTTIVAGCRVHGDEPLTPETREALGRVIEAARSQITDLDLPRRRAFICIGCGEEQLSAFRCADPRCPPFVDRLALSKAAHAANKS